jgi:HEAT repeat protein
MSRKTILFSSAVITTALFVLAYLWLGPSSTPAARVITLAVGDERVYGLAWTSKQKTLLEGGGEGKTIPVEAGLTLDATWVLQVLRATPEGYLISARFVEVGQGKLEAMGQDLLAGGFDLTRDEVFFELSRRGQIGELQFGKDTSDLYRDLVQGLLMQVQVVLPSADESRWSERLPGPHGAGEVSFALREAGEIERVRKAYELLTSLPGGSEGRDVELDARATFALDESGYFATLRDAESITVSKAGNTRLEASSRLELELIERRRATSKRVIPSAVEGRVLSDRGPSEHAERRLLQARARKISIESLESLVLAHPDGAIPDKGELAWRMAALLRLHPELCERLVSLFKRDELEARARGFVMDLLVASGDAAAQAALRKILTSDEARGDGEAYGLYMQRLSLLERPEEDTLAFLEERYDVAREGEDRELSHSTLMALGAATGKARRSGDDDLAEAYEERLLRELEGAETSSDSAVRLRALGNTGDPKHVQTITDYAAHEDSEVRHASARALYQVASHPEARATLVALSRDPAVNVQAAALQALANAKLGREELSALQQALQSGQTRTELDGMVLNLVASQTGHEDVKAELLETVLSRHAGDARLEARVRALLRKQGS